MRNIPVSFSYPVVKRMTVAVTDSAGLEWSVDVDVEETSNGHSVALVGAYLDNTDLTHIMSDAYIKYLEGKAADRVCSEIYS